VSARLGRPTQGSTPPAKGAGAALPDDALEIGRVVDAWGIKGWLKVQPFSSDPKALLAARRWFVRPPERPSGPVIAGRAPDFFPPTLTIREARVHADVVVASVDGVDDRAGAEALRGARIFIARSTFPQTEDDEFYWVDLIGLDVLNRAGEALGQVVGLIDTGPHCVLRIEPREPHGDGPAEERLIPFVSAYVDAVDLPQRRITVDWGLDY
jgi:16S rRNA processing protein RimM